MEFNSLFFICMYMPLFVGAMCIIKNNKIRNLIVLIFSLLFYLLGNTKYFVLLLVVAGLTYLVGLKVVKNKGLYFGYISTIVLLLCFFKYGNFVISSLQDFAGISSIVMPLGVSFYVFTSISYVSDVYYEKIEKETKLTNVVMFMTFFPSIVSGPLLRYKSFREYIDHKEIKVESIAAGLRRFIMGLGKKVILANQLAVITDTVFSPNINVTFVLGWYGLLAYTLQLFFDFDGYSDMAIGIGQMAGFHVPENFNNPYWSSSIQEFWRRWHMTLGSWFRDYVYIPLGGNRVSSARWIFNTMVVWCLTGIWHGATFNYVLWGLYFGVLLIGEKYLSWRKNKNIFNWALTQALVVGGWLIFRTTSFAQFRHFVKVLLGLDRLVNMAYIKSLDVLYVLPFFGLAMLYCLPIVKNGLNELKRRNQTLYDVLLVCVFVFSIFLMVSGSYSSFIYFEF